MEPYFKNRLKLLLRLASAGAGLLLTPLRVISVTDNGFRREQAFGAMFTRHLPLLSPLCLMLLLCPLLSCGGGSDQPPVLPSVTSVTVSPNSVSVDCSAPQQFTASVQGTGSYSHAVNWSVNNIAGGNSTFGTIDTNGKYTAPASVPNPEDVVIRATSNADPTKIGAATASIRVAPVITSVALTPLTNSVVVGRSIELTITVTGTGNFQSSVKVYVNDVENGNTTVGTFTSAGNYTAPPRVPEVPVTLKAVSVADSSKSATATVQILESGSVQVSIAPAGTLALHWGEQKQLTATVTGASNAAVVWTASIGSVTDTGLYTAPSGSCCGDSVTAVSVADTSASAVKSVSLIPDPPKILAIDPDHATTGEYIHLTGQNIFASNEVPVHLYFTGPGGLPLHLYVPGLHALNNQISTVIPLGVQTGPLSLEIEYPWAPQPLRSDPVMFKRVPQLRIEPDLRELSSGESTAFQNVLLAADTPNNISWSADIGNIDSNGLYTAPFVSADTLAKITACIETTVVCQTSRIRIHPLRLDPFRALVHTGGNISLSALQGGSPAAANFTLWTPSGTLSSTGDYTAGAGSLDGGNIAIMPEYPGTSEVGFVGVLGRHPGEVSRIYDHLAFPYRDSSYFDNAVAVGNKLFVISDDAIQPFTSQTHVRLDVYDITDLSHPLLKSSVEPPLHPGRMWIDGNTLWMETWFDFREDFSSIVAGYDITGWTPHVTVLQKPRYGAGALNGKNIAWCATYYEEPNTIYCAEYSIDTASFNFFQLPKPDGVFVGSNNVLRFGNRVHLLFSDSNQFHITTYDLSTTPAAYIHDAVWPLPAGGDVGQLAFVNGTRVGVGPFLIDCAGELPTVLATLPTGRILDFDTKHLLGAVQGSLRVFDITDPTSPVRLIEIPLDSDTGGIPIQPKLAGDKVIAPTGQYGIAIFDISTPGGLLEKQMIGHTTAEIFDQVVRNNILYSGEIMMYDQNPTGSALEAWDISKNPAQELKSVPLGNEIPYATALSGNTLFVGTDTALHLFDVTSGDNPTEIKSMPANVRALSASGTLLFVSSIASGTVGVLTIFNISNPTNPAKLAELTLPVIPIRFAATGTVLYAAADSGGLLGVDISNPAAPTLRMQWQPVPQVEDVTIDGKLLLLAAGDRGLLIADATSPFAPLQLSATPLPYLSASVSGALDFPNGKPWAMAIGLHEGFAYVGGGQWGARLYIFDYRNAAHPRIIGETRNIATGGNFITSIVFSGTDVFYAGYNDAVYPPAIQADVSNPANVILLYPYLLEAAVSNAAQVGTTSPRSMPGSPKLQSPKARNLTP